MCKEPAIPLLPWARPSFYTLSKSEPLQPIFPSSSRCPLDLSPSKYYKKALISASLRLNHLHVQPSLRERKGVKVKRQNQGKEVMNKTKEAAKQKGAAPIFGFSSLPTQRVFSQIPLSRDTIRSGSLRRGIPVLECVETHMRW